MISSHPFLHVHTTWRNSYWLEIFRLRTTLNFCLVEIWFEMLKQSNFLRNFFWIVLETVLRSYVLLLSSRYLFPFVVIKVRSMLLDYNLRAIIEENTTRVVGQDVSQTILARVVNPFLNPNSLWVGRLSRLYFFAWTVLSLGWRYESYLPDWLRSAHWPGRVIWARPFQFNNLVTATDRNLHLWQSLKVVGWTCLLARSSQVCGAHSIRRHRFYGGNCLKVLSTTNRCE
jgi:hypothetical protein